MEISGYSNGNGCSLWSRCVSVQGIGIGTRVLLPQPTFGHTTVHQRRVIFEVNNLAGQSILSTTVEDKLGLGQLAGVY